jgi:hypothetical protein
VHIRVLWSSSLAHVVSLFTSSHVVTLRRLSLFCLVRFNLSHPPLSKPFAPYFPYFLSCHSICLENRPQICRPLSFESPFYSCLSVYHFLFLTSVPLFSLVEWRRGGGRKSRLWRGLRCAGECRVFNGSTGRKSATVLVAGKVFPLGGTFGTGTESSCRGMWTCCGFFFLKIIKGWDALCACPGG